MWRSDESQKILNTEYNSDFDEKRKSAMILSFHKYGAVKANYATGNVNAIDTLKKRLQLYEETGNIEWLIDVGNMAMIEFTHPQHPNAHYKKTESKESPGVVGLTEKEIEQLKEEP
jgi:hypothetical protein